MSTGFARALVAIVLISCLISLNTQTTLSLHNEKQISLPSGENERGPGDSVKRNPEFDSPDEGTYVSESKNLVIDRLRCIEKTVPLTYTRWVHDFIDYFTIKNRGYTREMIRRMNLYFPLFEKHLARHNLPKELKYLAVIESGLNPSAKSRVGATGLWQFMPLTGQQFGLSNDWYIDERRDPEKSTEAACRYLAHLYKKLNSWELVLLAYNSGPNKVRRAIRKAGHSRRVSNIRQYLPRETRSYLSQFVAMAYSLNYNQHHELCIPIEEQLPAYDTVHVKGFLNLETLASLTGTAADKLYELNPTIVHRVIPRDNSTYTLRVPNQTKAYLATRRGAILDSAAKVIPKEVLAYEQKKKESTKGRKEIFYIVKSGDMLLTIAHRFRVTVGNIQQWNKLQSTAIRVRQRLSIWVPHKSPHLVNRKSKPTRPPISLQKATTYTVMKGDTLWDISRKFEGLSVEKIKALNNLQSAQLYPGQMLVLK